MKNDYLISIVSIFSVILSIIIVLIGLFVYKMTVKCEILGENTLINLDRVYIGYVCPKEQYLNKLSSKNTVFM